MDGNMINNMRQPHGRRFNWLIWLLIVLVLLVGAVGVAGLAGHKIWQKLETRSEYQAVFLTNGQVYFGKLDYEDRWIVLRDIYYLQVTEELQPASSGSSSTPTETVKPNQQQQIQLVKLGSELHGPQDEMYIAKDKIIFWENMKDDSKVLQSIKQYQSK